MMTLLFSLAVSHLPCGSMPPSMTATLLPVQLNVPGDQGGNPEPPPLEYEAGQNRRTPLKHSGNRRAATQQKQQGERQQNTSDQRK
jgi:hypothetical protein